MMKKITLLLILLTVSFGYSQTNLEDFDGTPPTFNGFEGLGSAMVTTDTGGVNLAGQLITAAVGQGWQGAELIMQSNMIDLTTEKTVSVDIYSTVATSILGKVEDKVNNTAPASADGEAHGGTGWETITFTFNSGDDGTPTANGEYSQIAFFPLWNGGGWDTAVDGLTIYVDNITAVAGTAILTNLEDFESTPPTFNGFEGLGSAMVTTDTGGVNLAGQIITAAAGQGWQGAELIMQSNMIDLTTEKTISVDIYSTVATSILGKVEDKVNNTAPASADGEAHGGTGWETITFTFNSGDDGTPTANGEYSQIAFFPLWNGGGWDTAVDGLTIYVDNITAVAGTALGGPTCSDGIQNQGETGVDCGGVCAPCVVPPTSAAPTPPNRAPADVVSVYSDAYTGNIAYDNFDAGWCGGAAVTGVMISGNNTLQKNAGIDCQGIDFQSDRQDLSTFTHIHFDFYTNDTDLTGDVFNVKLVDFAGTGAEVTALEVNINTGTTPAIVADSWVSVDIDITVLGGVVTNNLTRSDVAQIGITTAFLTNVWYDNIYLYKGTPLGVDDVAQTSFKVYPNPAQDSWTVKTNNQDISSIQVYDILGKQVLSLTPNAREAKIDASRLTTGLYFAQIKTANGVKSVKLVKQ
jgi:hypothetical protein